MKIGFPYIQTGILAILINCIQSCSPVGSTNSDKADQQPDKEYTVAAYIWPSCHHDESLGNLVWPEGTSEWEVIKKGNLRVEGHYQPKIPLWGYEHDDDSKVMEKWIDAATSNVVNTFIFDWYWL